jgi:hypothetical protein
MARLTVGLGLVLGLAACGGSKAPATTPAPAARPAAAPAAPPAAAPAPRDQQATVVPLAGRGAGAPGAAGGRGGGGRGGPPVDSTKYVRTTPPDDPIIQRMFAEGMTNGQAGKLAQVLMDSIGPRLTGSPGYMAAANWAVKSYASWGIPAEKQQYGTWNSWRRGHTHVDLISPRLRSLEATMLGWSPGTGGKDVIGDVVLMPDVKSPEEFAAWATANAKGKIVLTSAPNPSCRMASQWTEFGQPGAAAAIAKSRADIAAAWRARTVHAGNPNEWPATYGVAAVIGTNWSLYPGINKVFGTPKQKVPTLDASCEDYNLLFRLAENNQGPKVRLNADAEFLGELPMYNVVGMIKGSEKPNEYILLSAHFDSWDGASGATDNGTGTITMMEAIRILKKVYPNPKRTIIIGNWGSEEQGLNGSQAFAEDHPEIIKGIRAGWNQDNGTGRVISLGAGPVTNATDNLISWLSAVPSSISGWIRLGATASPVGGSGSTDGWTFQCRGAPVHGMTALNWDYFNTTWHTNRDTYDKVVIDDLKNNATLVAMLTYMADKDPTLQAPQLISVNSANQAAITYPMCGANNSSKAIRKSTDSPR